MKKEKYESPEFSIIRLSFETDEIVTSSPPDSDPDQGEWIFTPPPDKQG